MVRIHPDPPECETARAPTKHGEAKGAVAQLGERLLCKQEVIGSIPFSSTNQVAEAARRVSARNHKQATERLLLAFCRTGSSVVL